MIDAALKLLTSHFVVRNPNVEIMTRYMKAFIREKRGYIGADKIPDAVVAIIVRDIFRRVTEESRDGRVRWGRFYTAIEFAADQVIGALKGDVGVDHRIKDILLFHRLV
jgi:hypothetical protein